MENVDTLLERIGEDESKREQVESALILATTLVERALEHAHRDVPEAVTDALVYEVAQGLYARQDAPSGIQQVAEYGSLITTRPQRDPLQNVWPIIRRYVLPL